MSFSNEKILKCLTLNPNEMLEITIKIDFTT